MDPMKLDPENNLIHRRMVERAAGIPTPDPEMAVTPEEFYRNVRLARAGKDPKNYNPDGTMK